jgi:hypothetical protein
MSTADQRQSGQQQWLEEYEELYSNFLMSVANTALLLTKHRAYLEEQLLTSSNPRDDNGPTDGSIEPTASTLAPRAQFWTNNGSPIPHLWTPQDVATYLRFILRSSDKATVQVDFWM